ncbi:hypothetical protein KKE34_05005 [Patescibacteria group bacterium]|nr:hypothetical protein [Patescibacteria group bacterium]MBU1885933.1 hypothetical protein [Patescibacteria group bacterium]
MKKKKNAKPYQEFETHINEIATKNKKEYLEKISDPNCKSLVCVDQNCKNIADWSPAGGGIFLSNTNKLKEWMKTKQSGTLNVHYYCGYMRVVMKLDSLKKQKQQISAFQTKVKQLNQKLKTKFKVEVEKDGSARPYMTE